MNSDDEQAREACQGDSDPGQLDLVGLVEAHHRAVYAYAYRLTGSVIDAEDLTQQTFLTAQQKASQIRQPEKAAAWLLAVTRNRFLKNRRRQSQAVVINLEAEGESIPDSAPEAGAMEGERLQQALAALSEPHRVVVLMYYFEDCSYREIAEQLDLPIGTVMSRLARAKRHLRDWLTCPQSSPHTG